MTVRTTSLAKRYGDATAEAGAPAGLIVEAAAAENTMLVDALREMHERITDHQFQFSGRLRDAGAPTSRSWTPLTAALSPEADFTRLDPLVVQALTINHRKIIVTDE